MFATISFAVEITADNYQRYLGKRIKFDPNTTSDSYKIGRKIFDNKNIMVQF
ncbi:MAG: hypothetical protein LBI01_01705 [Elusimicrobium sp.]|jgi:hypothetical protein|nr:hypothetical protein [Elusimicrobium sp.]